MKASAKTGALWKTGLTLWLLMAAGVVIAALIPFRYTVIRFALVAGIVAVWGGALVLFWRLWPVRLLALLTALVPVVLLFLPERPHDRTELRTAYLSALKSYQGTPYVWGGETRSGIDCSGLVRQALTDAALSEGFRTGNGNLLREGARFWWHDCSAKAIGEGYRGYSRRLMEARSLNEADYSRIQPGDVAVTANGTHILAYLGKKTWIQADPKAWKVVTTTAPTDDGWFIQDATLLRWRLLSEPRNRARLP
jgi:hypothetical protein